MHQVSLVASLLVVNMSYVFLFRLCRNIAGYERFRIRVGVVDVAI